MVFVRRTYVRAPVYAGDGLLSWARKAGKAVSKAIKNPVGQVARKIYNRTLAPVAKQALTGLVGEKLANSIENVGKRTLDGENIDQALVSEGKNLVKNEVQGVAKALTGGRVTTRIRTSDMMKAKPQVIKTVTKTKPRASDVMHRIAQEGNGLAEDTVL